MGEGSARPVTLYPPVIRPDDRREESAMGSREHSDRRRFPGGLRINQVTIKWKGINTNMYIIGTN